MYLTNSQYLVGSNWVTNEKRYDVVRLETPNDPHLKTSLMICAREMKRCPSWNAWKAEWLEWLLSNYKTMVNLSVSYGLNPFIHILYLSKFSSVTLYTKLNRASDIIPAFILLQSERWILDVISLGRQSQHVVTLKCA